MGTHGPIRYRVNGSYFDSIDFDEEAYWLGFIAADGTVVRSALVFNLAWKDCEHLEKFRKALNADQPVRRYNYTYPTRRLDFARFVISSKPFISSLSRFGIIPNKTNNLRFPSIKRSLAGAFVRGYFDGDGTVGRYGPTLRYSLRIVGSKRFLLDLKNIIPAKSRVDRHKMIWQLTFDSQKSIRRFANFIYKDATICLSRKRKIIEPILQMRICKWCKHEFEPSRMHWKLANYCSKACYQRAFRNSFSWKIDRSCQICHREYSPNRVHQITCSRKCGRRRSYLIYGC